MSEKKYNLSLARAYKINGGAWSVDIGAAEFDAIQQIQVGGRLVYKELKEESRKKDTSPHGYFQYMTPEEVKEFKKGAGSRGAKKSSKSSYKSSSNNSDQDF